MKWGLIKRLIFFTILFSGTISCCSRIPNINSFRNSQLPDPVAAEHATLFVLVNLNYEGQLTGIGSSGTGFGIAYQENSTIIMTAGHVCEPMIDKPGYENELSVLTVDGKKIDVEETIISKTQDLCLMKVNEILPIAKIAKSEPKSGDKIKYSGYPAGVYIPGTLHYFDGYMGGKDGENNHMYNIPTVGGASGSPIYNLDGEVVAIVSAVMIDFEHVTFAVGFYNILEFLKNNGLADS